MPTEKICGAVHARNNRGNWIVSTVKKMLVIKPRQCTGCRTCELACAMAKGSPEKLARPRIRIHRPDDGLPVQMTCLQCLEAACVKVCPVGALARNAETDAVVLDPERCIGCGFCLAACPFGHMAWARDNRISEKCDLCGGDPACARFCPSGALCFK
jgi:Fe-S-cluster-containing hydrogenase component 2